MLFNLLLRLPFLNRSLASDELDRMLADGSLIIKDSSFCSLFRKLANCLRLFCALTTSELVARLRNPDNFSSFCEGAASDEHLDGCATVCLSERLDVEGWRPTSFMISLRDIAISSSSINISAVPPQDCIREM